jgi:Lysine methyltransferase
MLYSFNVVHTSCNFLFPSFFLSIFNVLLWFPFFYSILELGSGTGVLGMALYKFLSLRHSNNNNDSNQRHQHRPIVALTDGDNKAVELLQQNLNHAGNWNALLPCLKKKNHDDDNDEPGECCCKATCLQWGNDLNQFDDWCRESFAPRTGSSIHGTTTSSQVADAEEETENVSSSSLPQQPLFVFDVIVAGKPKICS